MHDPKMEAHGRELMAAAEAKYASHENFKDNAWKIYLIVGLVSLLIFIVLVSVMGCWFNNTAKGIMK